MKKIKILLSVPILMLSCLVDEPDLFNEPSFTKVYGFDGPSYGQDFIMNSKGNYIIVGNFSKNSNFSSDEPIQGPFIIEADANGNQLSFRSFFISKANVPKLSEHYQNLYNLPQLDSTFVVWFGFKPMPSFFSVIQLKNDNYFITGAMYADTGPIEGAVLYIMILDPEFNIIELKYLNNSDLELKDGFVRTQYSSNLKLRLLDNGDVLMLKPRIWVDLNTNVDAYSLYRFKQDGEILSVFDIPWFDPTHEYFPLHISWTLDGQDHIVTSGLYGDNTTLSAEEDSVGDNNIWLQRIDINSGSVEKTVIFGSGNFNLNPRCGIVRTNNGFVLGDYHIDTVGEKNFDPDGDGFRNLYGGLWFLDANLDSIGKAHMTEAEVDNQMSRIIQTRDGGFVAAYQRKTFEKTDNLIVKSDAQGKVLWRKELDIGFTGAEGISRFPVSKVIESQDGGIVILGNVNFNFSGNRINLIKISADGKF